MLELDLNELLNPQGFNGGLNVPPGTYELRQGIQVLLAAGLSWQNSTVQVYPDPNQANPAALSFIENGQRLEQPLDHPDVALVWEAINELNTEELVDIEDGMATLDSEHLQAMLAEVPVVLSEMTDSDEDDNQEEEAGEEAGDDVN